MRLVLGAALLWVAAPAWAGPAARAEAPIAPAHVPTTVAATPGELLPVICTAPGGRVHVVVHQPDRSTFAAGPGECWLTVNGTHPDSPVRLYLTFEAPGHRMGASLGDSPADATEWVKSHHLLRGRVEVMDSGKIAIGDVPVPYHRLRGLPEGSETTRDVMFGHVVSGGMDVIFIAHWDAFHPDGLGDEAFLALRRMSLHEGERPALAAMPPLPEPVADAPSGGPLPAAIGEPPPDEGITPTPDAPPPAALGDLPPGTVDIQPIPPQPEPKTEPEPLPAP